MTDMQNTAVSTTTAASSTDNPYPDLPTIVDIGGEIYSFSRQRKLPIELHLRTLEEFLHNYNCKPSNLSTTERLVRTYLPYGAKKDVVTYLDMPNKDRQELVSILETRVAKLREAVKLKKNRNQFYVRNLRDEISARDIQKLADFFKGLHKNSAVSSGPVASAPPEIPGYKTIKIQTPSQASETKQRLSALSEDEKTEQILRMAFYTLHPDKLDRTILTEWETIQDWAKNAGPSDFIQQIRQSYAQAETKAKIEGQPIPTAPPIQSLNWLKRMNYARLQTTQNQNASKAVIKESIIRLESDEEKERTRAINSLRKILLVLAQKKYITEENAKISGNSDNVSNALEEKLRRTLKTRLYVSLSPLFDTFSILYSDYYNSILEFLRLKKSQFTASSATASGTASGIFETLLKLHDFLEDVQLRSGRETSYPIHPGALYKIDSPPFTTEFKTFLTELFQTLETIPGLPVKEMDPKLYAGFANKKLIGYGPQPPIPGQTIMDAAKMKEFLGIQPKSEPLFLFPELGGTGPTTTFYSVVAWDVKPPEIQQNLVITKLFRDLFAPNRDKMLTVEAMRIIILAMYQVILENGENGAEVPVPTE
jgi:hypothetical protein